MMRALPLLLLACTDGTQGTSIGNPTKTLMRVAPPGDGVRLTSAEMTVTSLTVSGPDGESTVRVPDGTDVLEGIEFSVSGRSWTALELEIEGPLTVLGEDAGAPVDLELEVQSVSVTAGRQDLEFGEPHVFELAFPGWLEAANAGWTRGEEHVVRPGEVTHDTLVDLIRQRSALHVDFDDDGRPDR